MQMQSPTRLGENSQIDFLRQFHVEMLRGGMNRLLLRAIPTKEKPTRVEVFFQYVQHIDIPMTFSGLTIRDMGRDETVRYRYGEVLRKFPECRVFQLESGGAPVGEIVAAACVFGEDSASLGTESMFPMMA
jgi:hypothetical protein